MLLCLVVCLTLLASFFLLSSCLYLQVDIKPILIVVPATSLEEGTVKRSLPNNIAPSLNLMCLLVDHSVVVVPANVSTCTCRPLCSGRTS